jgi:hypothetical protein
MLKQQTVPTSLGQLTVSSLTLGELRQLDALFQQEKPEKPSLTSILVYMPIIAASTRKVHQDLTTEQLENGLTMEDFNVMFDAVMEVSGLKAAPGKKMGEAQPEITPVPV